MKIDRRVGDIYSVARWRRLCLLANALLQHVCAAYRAPGDQSWRRISSVRDEQTLWCFRPPASRAVSINQTAPVAVAHGHYGRRPSRHTLCHFVYDRPVYWRSERPSSRRILRELFFPAAAASAVSPAGMKVGRRRVVDKLSALWPDGGGGPGALSPRAGLMPSPRPRDLFVAALTTCRRFATNDDARLAPTRRDATPPARLGSARVAVASRRRREIFQKQLMQH